MKKLLLFAVIIILLQCTSRTIIENSGNACSGGSCEDIHTAIVYNPDLTPAIGATVRFYPINDTTRIPAWQDITDTAGRYAFQGLAKGMYNIIANKDSLYSFQDSVFIGLETAFLHPDTLGQPGSFTAIVGLQPNHHPMTVTAQALGTNIYCNVDSNGRFTLKPLAKGIYNLRLVTILPDYTPRYTSMTLEDSKNDTLNDTIWIPYNGIPVVRGLKTEYDTVNGLVRLIWNKTSYWDFQKYAIFRDDYLSIKPSIEPIAASTDTIFIDTIFKRQLSSGLFSFSDTNDYHYRYRVAIWNNAEELGKTYKNVDIIAVSPTKAKTKIQFSIYHILKQYLADSASINDSLLYRVQAENFTRKLKRVDWLDSAGIIIHTMQMETSKKAIEDSLIYIWKDIGRKNMICKIIDEAGIEWNDTIGISIVIDEPLVTLTSPNQSYRFGDTIHLHADMTDKFGSITKIEWSIGETVTFSVNMVSDTIMISPNVLNTNYKTVVRVTNDDGNIALDTVKLFISAYGGLVLWNKLGSIEQIENSEIGNNGKIINGTDSIFFNTVKYGNGIKVNSLYDFKTYVYFNVDQTSPTDSWTIEMWHKPEHNSDYSEIAKWTGEGEKCGQSGYLGCTWYWEGSTGLRFIVYEGPRPIFSSNIPKSLTPFAANDVIHFAVVMNRNGIDGTSDIYRCYWNGALAKSWTTATAMNYSSNLIFTGIGLGRAGYLPWAFSDNIKIYNYAKIDFSDRFIE